MRASEHRENIKITPTTIATNYFTDPVRSKTLHFQKWTTTNSTKY
jgi:hypothetical protein